MHTSLQGMDVYSISHQYDMHNSSTKTLMRLISDRDRDIYQVVNFYVLNTIISLFGVAANVMNICVFYRQGFKNTMNISFFALAVSDLSSLIILLWYNVILSGLLMRAGFAMDPPVVAYLTGGHPHICFARITSWITVFITAERCLCIIVPLKVKQIITPRRTTVILCSLYILIILSFEPEYRTAYLGWVFDGTINRTILGIIVTSDREESEAVVFILYSILGFTSFVTVIIFTLLLVIQLNKQSKWRQQMNVENNRSEAISNRERKTMTMVVMIATVLIVCYSPGVAISIVTFFEPEFSVGGQYVNGFFAIWSFVFVCNGINSSVNIFLYYHMSSKYRETFRLLFCFGKSRHR